MRSTTRGGKQPIRTGKLARAGMSLPRQTVAEELMGTMARGAGGDEA